MYVKILLPPPIRIQDTIKPSLAIIGSILNILFHVKYDLPDKGFDAVTPGSGELR